MYYIIGVCCCICYSSLFFFVSFFLCPCMATYVSVQYNGGLLPDIILLTQCYYHRGTRLNAMKRFCLTFFPLCGMLRRSRCVQTNCKSGHLEKHLAAVHTRYFQHAHFIPIVGLGKRGEYELVHGDLPRQHPFGTTLRFTGPVPANSRQ